MKDIVFEKFKENAIIYKNMNLFFWKTAVEIVQFCEENQITIWGFDSFQIKSDGIHPFQEYSPNYSNIEKDKTWEKAQKDLNMLTDTPFVFEIVYDIRECKR